MALRDVEVNGTLVPKGAHMLLVYDSGNDDETVFPDPRRFDMDRPNLGRHVAFGGGPHRCVGLALARMEIKLAAQEIARQLKDIRLAIAESEVRYLPTGATHTIESLPSTYARR
jgi:cytochrome P450